MTLWRLRLQLCWDFKISRKVIWLLTPLFSIRVCKRAQAWHSLMYESGIEITYGKWVILTPHSFNPWIIYSNNKKIFWSTELA